jgi:hypothetical protein
LSKGASTKVIRLSKGASAQVTRLSKGAGAKVIRLSQGAGAQVIQQGFVRLSPNGNKAFVPLDVKEVPG